MRPTAKILRRAVILFRVVVPTGSILRGASAHNQGSPQIPISLVVYLVSLVEIGNAPEACAWCLWSRLGVTIRWIPVVSIVNTKDRRNSRACKVSSIVKWCLELNGRFLFEVVLVHDFSSSQSLTIHFPTPSSCL